MKNIVLSLFTFLLMLPLIAQTEGSFTVNINEGRFQNKKVDASSIDFAFKGDKFLITPKMSKGQNVSSPGILFDMKKKQMVVMMNNDGKKSAMILDMPDLENQDMMKGQTYDPADYKITTTKEKKIIEGYEAVKVKVEGKDFSSDVWVTKDVNFDFNEITKLFGSGMSGSPAMFDLKSFGIGGFPLMVIVKDKNGKEEMVMTISNIQKKVNDKMFSLEGYETNNMGK